LFLFNDILLWTTNGSKFRGHLQLSGCTVSEVNEKKKPGFKLFSNHSNTSSGDSLDDSQRSSTHEETKGALTESGGDVKSDKYGRIKPIIFLCKDEQEAKNWVNDIQDAIRGLKEIREVRERVQEEVKSANQSKKPKKKNKRYSAIKTKF